ncbi:MAG: hypothetical protein Q9169_006556 [Polycauliona sp. 2 TL-2023]
MGDSHAAFTTLQQQISTLASDFCSICPVEIPSHIARNLPTDLPPFLVDTPASTPLRIAYVQSLISTIINTRIFQPFLFTYPELDNHFNEWGEYLRAKSTKREAVWRQRTLHAAFSCPSSKKRINGFAAGVVDEVVAAIKPFTNRDMREGLRGKVRGMVKVAAETWRVARIELTRFRASSCFVGDVEGGKNGGDGGAVIEVFPRIERVALPRDFRLDGEEEDVGCVFTSGEVLSRDSTIVLARRREMGEDVEVPESVHDGYDDDARSIGSGIQSIASRASHKDPGTAESLRTSTGTRSGRGETFDGFDGTSEDGKKQSHERGKGWNLETEHDIDGGDARYSRQHPDDHRHDEVTATDPTASSPRQSPSHSPFHSPTRSAIRSPPPSRKRTTTADSTSSTGDDEDEAVYQEAETRRRGRGGVPDWGDAGGNVNVPGAFGGEGDERW